MNAKKTMKGVLAGLAVLALTVTGAYALDPEASNNSASFQIRITPNVDLGVTVDTNGAAWSGDTDLYTDMALGDARVLQTGVRVVIAGNFQKQEIALQATNIDVWVLDTTEGGTEDELRLYAMVGADQLADVPLAAAISGAGNLLTISSIRAGQPQGSESGDGGHTYEFLTGAGARYADVDDMAVSTARRLWLHVGTPPSTTVDSQQKFTITVTAVTGAGQ